MTADLLIKAEETLVLKPYWCSEHKRTIGWGYNMQANPLPVDMAAYLKAHGMITKEMADMLFEGKYQDAVKKAKDIFLTAWPHLNDARQAVVVSMIYQMGDAGFLKFKNTIQYIKTLNWLHAAYNMLQSKWEDQTEDRAHRHALMMATGQWLLP